MPASRRPRSGRWRYVDGARAQLFDRVAHGDAELAVHGAATAADTGDDRPRDPDLDRVGLDGRDVAAHMADDRLLAPSGARSAVPSCGS